MNEKRSIEFLKEKMRKDPYGNFLGIELDKLEEGYARVSVSLKKEFCNFSDYIHGGLIFSLADQAFAAASNSRGVLSLALQMNINYVKAPSVGNKLVAEAREEHVSRKIGLYQITVEDSSHQLVAQAQGIVYRK